MGDPIPRWRNPKLTTVLELVSILPNSIMKREDARKVINKQWNALNNSSGAVFFRTAYQTAKSLGLYYEDAENYYPKFSKTPSPEQLKAYMQNWIDSYYVPNPYVPSMNSVLDNPINISSAFIQCILKNDSRIEWSAAKNEVFGNKIGNSDILRNTLNEHSRWLFLTESEFPGGGGSTKYIDIQNLVKLRDTTEEDFKKPPEQYNSQKVFFEHFPFDEKEQSMMTFKSSDQNLNQILYGPPGTGKTYSTITKALSIIGLIPEKENYTEEEYNEAKELFKSQIGDRIEFVTMHQSFSYEDFVQGLKPIPKEDDSTGMDFEYKNGVFKNLCERAEKPYVNGSDGADPYFASYMLAHKKFDDHIRSKIYQKENGVDGKVSKQETLAYFIKRTKSGSIKIYRDKYDGVLGGKEGGITSRDGFKKEKFRKGEWDSYKKLIKKYDKLSDEEKLEKLDKGFFADNVPNEGNYVIILDEINRCDISKVFGELITLIEDDKRDFLKVTLPSGDKFSVPQNLYIIGTMNTADKSIAMVDFALRRRFEFIPLYANPELVKEKDKKEFLIKVNKNIVEERSIDLQIGHADFMNKMDLVDIINKKTIPLLLQYFRNDIDKVREIIEKSTPPRVLIDSDWFKKSGLLKVNHPGPIA